MYSSLSSSPRVNHPAPSLCSARSCASAVPLRSSVAIGCDQLVWSGLAVTDVIPVLFARYTCTSRDSAGWGKGTQRGDRDEGRRGIYVDHEKGTRRGD